MLNFTSKLTKFGHKIALNFEKEVFNTHHHHRYQSTLSFPPNPIPPRAMQAMLTTAATSGENQATIFGRKAIWATTKVATLSLSSVSSNKIIPKISEDPSLRLINKFINKQRASGAEMAPDIDLEMDELKKSLKIESTIERASCFFSPKKLRPF